MAMMGSADLRQTIQSELAREAGTDADAKALAAAALRLSDALGSKLAVLIGAGGVRALAARSLHIVQPGFPWLNEPRSGSPEGPFAQIALSMERQEPGVAVEAAAAVLATLVGLLVTLIGETLTMGVLRAAWPSVFPNETQQEARNR